MRYARLPLGLFSRYAPHEKRVRHQNHAWKLWMRHASRVLRSWRTPCSSQPPSTYGMPVSCCSNRMKTNATVHAAARAVISTLLLSMNL